MKLDYNYFYNEYHSRRSNHGADNAPSNEDIYSEKANEEFANNVEEVEEAEHKNKSAYELNNDNEEYKSDAELKSNEEYNYQDEENLLKSVNFNDQNNPLTVYKEKNKYYMSEEDKKHEGGEEEYSDQKGGYDENEESYRKEFIEDEEGYEEFEQGNQK